MGYGRLQGHTSNERRRRHRAKLSAINQQHQPIIGGEKPSIGDTEATFSMTVLPGGTLTSAVGRRPDQSILCDDVVATRSDGLPEDIPAL
jgi:hypothetical protein